MARSRGDAVRVSIVVPTYNERESVPLLRDGLRRSLDGAWDYELIVVDDSSPDGTAEVVRRLAAEDPRVRLIVRPGKLGLGSAVVAGFRAARGDFWVMMDADLSHNPDDLPGLLRALSGADIVVGSRYVAGGGVVAWPLWRRLASRTASELGRWLVGLSVRDATSGFAAFRREALEPLLPALDPKGFKLLFEILAKARGVRVAEAPITFTDRRHGTSKFGPREVVRYLRLCLELRGTRGRG